MFDIGWQELLVIAIVMIVVVGPKDLPKMLRAFGKATARMRTMAGDFKAQFDEALREAELDDVRKTIADARSLNPTQAIRDAMNPLKQVGEDIRAGLDNSVRTTPVETPVTQEADVSSQPTVPMAEPMPTPIKSRTRKPATKKAPARKTSARTRNTAKSAVQAEPIAAVEPATPPRTAKSRKKPAAASAAVASAPEAAAPAKAAAAPRARKASVPDRLATSAKGKAPPAFTGANPAPAGRKTASRKPKQVGSDTEVAAAKTTARARGGKSGNAAGRSRTPKSAANGHAAPNGVDTTDNT